MSFPTADSPWRLPADIEGKKKNKRRKILNIAVKLQEEDGTALTRTAKVLRSRVESKHAAENMSHGLVRIIFCFN